MDLAGAAAPRAVLPPTPLPSSESGPAEADMLTAQRLRAVSAFLLDRRSLLLPLAFHLCERHPIFESTIRGRSMEPAIPGLARLRVQLLGQQPCQRGDIVFYLAESLPGTTYDGYIVHRVVSRKRSGSPVEYLLTRGDNSLAPDPPVRSDQVLGTVIAVQTASGWRPPGPLLAAPCAKRVIRAVTLAAVCMALWCSASAARRLAAWLLNLERVGRLSVWRLRRRMSRFQGKEASCSSANSGSAPQRGSPRSARG